MFCDSRSALRSVLVLITILAVGLVNALAQTTIYWQKDHLRDASGAVIATASPAPSDGTPPSTPGTLTATVNDNSVEFSWGLSTDSGGSGLAGYKLYRGSLPVAVVNASTTSYIDATLQAQTSHSYTVVSFDWAGNHSSPSNTAAFTTSNVAGPGVYDGGNSLVTYSGSGWANDTNHYPLAYNGTQHYSGDTGAQSSFTFSGDSVTVFFTKFPHMGIANVAIGQANYTLDMYTPVGQWQVAQTYSGLGSGTHTITLTVSGQKNGSSSGTYMIIDAFGVGVPAPPSALSATVVSGTQINLAWADNSSNEAGFKIERKVGLGGTYAEIASVGANTTSYSSTGLTDGTVYYYRVRSNNTSGNSAFSDSASACNCTIKSAGIYDGNDSSILYTGSGWFNDPNSYPSAYNSTQFYGNTTADKATFSFTGSSITWLHLRYFHMGIANVVIDGNNMGDIDLYSSANLWQQSTTWSGLSQGNHTITITIAGTKNSSSSDYYVDIDAFLVD
jgi:hypothetical protein